MTAPLTTPGTDTEDDVAFDHPWKVIVWDDPSLVGSESTDWWMGQILWVEGGARDPKVPTLFQVSDVDTGVIRWVNADQVKQIMLPFELPADS